MKKINLTPSLRYIRKYGLAILFSLYTLASFGQGEKELKAIESIAGYLHHSSTFTDQILSHPQINFTPTPGSPLAFEWPTLNAMTKVAIVYKAAEDHTQGKGNYALALLSQSIAQHYEGSYYEKSLEPFRNIKVTEKIQFSMQYVENKPLIVLPEKIKAAIGTIAKYIEAGTLGGLRETLIHHFGLTELEANDVMLKNRTIEGALIEAYLHPSVNNNDNITLKGIASRLFNLSEPATHDNRLLDLFNEDPMLVRYKFFKQELYNPSKEELNKSKEGFKEYIEEINTPDPGKDTEINDGKNNFEKIMRSPKGPGGIMLGNNFSVSFAEKLNSVNWIPDNMDSKRGRLEFIIDGQQILRLNDVFQEDVYAASQIILSDSILKYASGDAIVLTGLEYLPYPSGITRFKPAVINPGIKYLSLGKAIVTCDAYPDAWGDIENSLKEIGSWGIYRESAEKWKAVKPTGWKITESPLLITRQKGEINVVDSASLSNFFFRMVGDQDGFENDVEAFSNLLPAIFEISPDFNRLREFTKVITLFRWAKMSNAPIRGLKTFRFNSFTYPPSYFIITAAGNMHFSNSIDCRRLLRPEINSVLDSIDVKKHGEILREIKKVINKRDKLWTKIKKSKEAKIESFGLSNKLVAYLDSLTTTKHVFEKILIDLYYKDSVMLLEYSNEINKLISIKKIDPSFDKDKVVEKERLGKYEKKYPEYVSYKEAYINFLELFDDSSIKYFSLISDWFDFENEIFIDCCKRE